MNTVKQYMQKQNAAEKMMNLMGADKRGVSSGDEGAVCQAAINISDIICRLKRKKERGEQGFGAGKQGTEDSGAGKADTA